MKKYSIYNKSSENMSEIKNGSIDLIVGSPPYNIGTKYGEFGDKSSLDAFKDTLSKIYAECFRVLKDDGILIVECADSVVSDKNYVQLTGYIQSLCVNLGLKLKERHINFAYTEKGIEMPEHNWNPDYTTQKDAHSNCHQIIVMSKSKDVTFNPVGKIMYFNYTSVEGHPCPTPEGIYDFVLDNYFKKDMSVMDPFMGTAILGKEVLARDGQFYGYELDASIFKIAEKNLENK